MCWSGVAFNHCYDCAKEFNHRAHVIPCYANQNGKACAYIQIKEPVIQTAENCAECKSSRRAEEECQRMIYRSRPLNLDVKGKERMQELSSSYRQIMEEKLRIRKAHESRKEADRQRAKENRGKHGDQKKAGGDQKADEDFVMAPRMVTARHQHHDYVPYESLRN